MRRMLRLLRLLFKRSTAFIMFWDDGIEFKYPHKKYLLDQRAVDSMDFLRYALDRHDWQDEWHTAKIEQENWEREMDYEAQRSMFTMIQGGLEDDEK